MPPADPRPRSRCLTPGEIALAASVFGATLDPGPVTVRCAKFWALHPWWVTMAPDGHIWCHPNGFTWVADFAAQPLGFRAHFIHEMVHVWQRQQGINLILRRPPLARYRYRLEPGKPFARYGIEQQACIVADAYLIRSGRVRVEKGSVGVRPGADLADYAAILPFGEWNTGIA